VAVLEITPLSHVPITEVPVAVQLCHIVAVLNYRVAKDCHISFCSQVDTLGLKGPEGRLKTQDGPGHGELLRIGGELRQEHHESPVIRSFVVDCATIIAAVETPKKMLGFRGHILLGKAVEPLQDPQRVLSLARSSSADRGLTEDRMRTDAVSLALDDKPWTGTVPSRSRGSTTTASRTPIPGTSSSC
jgi:hypothetical protein